MAANGCSAIGELHTTKDGRDWATLWSGFQSTLELLNTQRTAVASLFTSTTTAASDWVEQSTAGTEFEEASEFGVPKSARVSPSLIALGYRLRWWDVRKGWTWPFLAEVESGRLESIHAAVLDADNRLVFRHVVCALLNKTTIATRPVNENNVWVYALWDGETDATPPAYAGKSFTAGHNHYAATDGDPTGAHLGALSATSPSTGTVLTSARRSSLRSQRSSGPKVSHSSIPRRTTPPSARRGRPTRSPVRSSSPIRSSPSRPRRGTFAHRVSIASSPARTSITTGQ